MPIRGMMTALCLTAMLAAPATADPTGATSIIEEEAVAFRRLQSELMVAALSCNDARHRDQYNAFVTRFRPALGENARVLKAYFKRMYGPVSQRRLDDFITGLANEASLASMGDMNFCIHALTRFEAINSAEHDSQTASMILQGAALADER